MVAVARLINATLVIPELDKRSLWQDSRSVVNLPYDIYMCMKDFLNLIFNTWNCSNFSDVFDEYHFINSLADDVKIIKKLPKELIAATRAVKHFRSWSGVDYYEQEIARMWDEYQVPVKTEVCSRMFLLKIYAGAFSRWFEQQNLILVWQTITYLLIFKSCDVVLAMKPFVLRLKLREWER